MGEWMQKCVCRIRWEPDGGVYANVHLQDQVGSLGLVWQQLVLDGLDGEAHVLRWLLSAWIGSWSGDWLWLPAQAPQKFEVQAPDQVGCVRSPPQMLAHIVRPSSKMLRRLKDTTIRIA